MLYPRDGVEGFTLPVPPAVDYRVTFRNNEAGPWRTGDVIIRKEIYLDSPIVAIIPNGSLVRCENPMDKSLARKLTTGEFRMKIRQVHPWSELQPEGWVTHTWQEYRGSWPLGQFLVSGRFLEACPQKTPMTEPEFQ